jgi:FMN phosphatase YigB (HAD superfamily)
MKKVLLLDYDGVVLRNRTASSLITKRAGLFTQSVFTRKNNITITTKDASDLSYNLYKGYGHTLLGLNGIGLKNVLLKDYNNFVYSHIDYDELIMENNDMKDINHIVSTCKAQKIDVFFFSNAPRVWIYNTLKRNKYLSTNICDVRDILEISDNDCTFLKPKSEIYDALEERFKNNVIVFVDDNSYNMTYTINKNNWINVLYCGVNSDVSDNMYLTRDLKSLVKLF